MYRKNRHFLMSALSVALGAGLATLGGAVEAAEKFAVTGALKVTHMISEQVCTFDTLEQLEGYLDTVADRHHWFRHDMPAPAAAPIDETPLAAPMGLSQIVGETTALDQIDTAGAQVSALAADAAPAAVTTVNLDLAQLRDGAAPADAISVATTTPETGGQMTAQLDAAGSPMRNPHYAGQFEDETAEQAEARRAAAAAAEATTTPPAADAAAAPASTETPAA